MKTMWILLLCSLMGMSSTRGSNINENSFTGSWEYKTFSETAALRHVLVISDGFFAWTICDADDGQFYSTQGGGVEVLDDKLIFDFEFHTEMQEKVGKQESWTFEISKSGELQLAQDGKKMNWTPLDAAESTALTGAYLFSGRERNGEITRVDQSDQPRKTMKLLTHSRFQWIAYNTETGAFFGTGGGTYTAENGQYTEHIDLFSRDKSRIGAKLSFDFEVKDQDWHHKGKSSSGEPMYEIWTRRN